MAQNRVLWRLDIYVWRYALLVVHARKDEWMNVHLTSLLLDVIIDVVTYWLKSSRCAAVDRVGGSTAETEAASAHGQRPGKRSRSHRAKRQHLRHRETPGVIAWVATMFDQYLLKLFSHAAVCWLGLVCVLATGWKRLRRFSLCMYYSVLVVRCHN